MNVPSFETTYWKTHPYIVAQLARIINIWQIYAFIQRRHVTYRNILRPKHHVVTYYSDVTWALRRLKSPKHQLLVQQIAQVSMKNNVKFYIIVSLRLNHWWSVDSPPKGPVLRKAFPCYGIVMGLRVDWDYCSSFVHGLWRIKKEM